MLPATLHYRPARRGDSHSRNKRTDRDTQAMRDIRHFIDGAAFDGASGRFSDVFNPNTGDVQARVQLATTGEVDRAVQAAQNAFDGWASTNPQRRARVMFDFKRLVE